MILTVIIAHANDPFHQDNDLEHDAQYNREQAIQSNCLPRLNWNCVARSTTFSYPTSGEI